VGLGVGVGSLGGTKGTVGRRVKGGEEVVDGLAVVRTFIPADRLAEHSTPGV